MTLAQLVETDTSPGKQEYRHAPCGAAASALASLNGRGATCHRDCVLTRLRALLRSWLYQFALDNPPSDGHAARDAANAATHRG
jgi:hypothetical protein